MRLVNGQHQHSCTSKEHRISADIRGTVVGLVDSTLGPVPNVPERPFLVALDDLPSQAGTIFQRVAPPMPNGRPAPNFFQDARAQSAVKLKESAERGDGDVGLGDAKAGGIAHLISPDPADVSLLPFSGHKQRREKATAEIVRRALKLVHFERKTQAAPHPNSVDLFYDTDRFASKDHAATGSVTPVENGDHSGDDITLMYNPTSPDNPRILDLGSMSADGVELVVEQRRLSSLSWQPENLGHI
ncbi:unnamed protein product [Amoebophrya sp. A25]|nr:unnamed protein product [Amoebophrya sp. A25]|eukprot:GSA25T00002530001.1